MKPINEIIKELTEMHDKEAAGSFSRSFIGGKIAAYQEVEESADILQKALNECIFCDDVDWCYHILLDAVEKFMGEKN